MESLVNIKVTKSTTTNIDKKTIKNFFKGNLCQKSLNSLFFLRKNKMKPRTQRRIISFHNRTKFQIHPSRHSIYVTKVCNKNCNNRPIANILNIITKNLVNFFVSIAKIIIFKTIASLMPPWQRRCQRRRIFRLFVFCFIFSLFLSYEFTVELVENQYDSNGSQYSLQKPCLHHYSGFSHSVTLQKMMKWSYSKYFFME